MIQAAFCGVFKSAVVLYILRTLPFYLPAFTIEKPLVDTRL